ncbi:MAG: response regulator transcription factor [Thermoanaerobaculia bacterium]|nr:response regulator transcription factor [Thermoanaerobaculia bacterium]
MERRDFGNGLKVAPGTPLLLLEPDSWRASSLVAFLSEAGFRVEGQPSDKVRPAIVLANLAWPGTEVRDRLEIVKRDVPEPRIVAFVSSLASETVFPSLKLGVKGVLSLNASAEELRSALVCVMTGSIWAPRAILSQWIDRVTRLGWSDAVERVFTPAERRVLAGLEDNLSNKEIGQRLGVTEATVKFHIGKLLKKTGASGRRDLVKFATDSTLV